MKKPTRKQVLWTGAGVLLLLLIVYGFLPDPATVQTAAVERGPLRVTIEEEGQTRVSDSYVVTAPVAGHMRRIDVEPGDVVAAGQTLVALEPPRATDLDPRMRREALARVDAARAAVAGAREQTNAAEATARQATNERDRIERLVAADAATRRSLEHATVEAEQAVATAEAARAQMAAAEADLAAAQGALAPTGGPAAVRQTISAPSGGQVLTVYRRDAGHVNPGEPILEIGDTRRLEAVVDVLSQDAVRIRPGTPVLFDQWGGAETLHGVVDRIEPSAFTQVSALGVEEQRVPVIIGMRQPGTDEPETVVQPLTLGSGYRLLARFVIWEDDDVLQVPTGALFQADGGWALFVVEGGRAELRSVSVGQRSGLRAQILQGLAPGDVVIVHPDDNIEEGRRVRTEH